MAIHAVKEVLPGFDGVTTEEYQVRVLNILCDWEEKLFEKINADDGDS